MPGATSSFLLLVVRLLLLVVMHLILPNFAKCKVLNDFYEFRFEPVSVPHGPRITGMPETSKAAASTPMQFIRIVIVSNISSILCTRADHDHSPLRVKDNALPRERTQKSPLCCIVLLYCTVLGRNMFGAHSGQATWWTTSAN